MIACGTIRFTPLERVRCTREKGHSGVHGDWQKYGEEEVMDFGAQVREEVVQARQQFPNQERTLRPAEWLAILIEEVGEVARSLNDGDANELIERELIQVAAMAERMYASLIHNVDAGRGWSARGKVEA